MSDEILSQEEIDALASGNLPSSYDGSGSDIIPEVEESLNLLEGQISNQMSTALSTALSLKVEVTKKQIEVFNSTDIVNVTADDIILINTSYSGALSGVVKYVIKKADVAMIADLMMMGEGTTEFLPDHVDAIGEAFNQINGGLNTALNGLLGAQISIGQAEVSEITGNDLGAEYSDHYQYNMRIVVGDKLDSEFFILIDSDMALSLQDSNKQESGGGAAAPSGSGGGDSPKVAVSEPKLPDFSKESPTGVGTEKLPQNIEMLLDIALPVTIELGRTNMVIRDILELGHGSIVELDKLAGEPVDILVNDKVIARGEVVVIDENFGVRITNLVGVDERINSLRT